LSDFIELNCTENYDVVQGSFGGGSLNSGSFGSSFGTSTFGRGGGMMGGGGSMMGGGGGMMGGGGFGSSFGGGSLLFQVLLSFESRLCRKATGHHICNEICPEYVCRCDRFDYFWPLRVDI
jgi:hypothetical protein